MLANELKAFICFFCGERFSDKHCLTCHQYTCSMRSVGLQTLFTNLSLPRHHETGVPNYSRLTKRSFLKNVNIIPVERAEALDRRNCGEQVVCDIIVIDNSDEDDSEVESHYHPSLSPRSLIPSDGKNFKRSSIIHQTTERKKAVVLKRGNDTVVTLHSAEKLLRIDICSPLGQRLGEHVSKLNKSKSYFQTEKPSSSKSSRFLNNNGNSYYPLTLSNDRLRQPTDYRVTFRPSRQESQSSYSHAYKFTRRQRKEFCSAFDCGLSVRARRILRRMKPCRVKVPKLPLQRNYSSVPESELTSDQSRLLYKPVVLLSKCNLVAAKENSDEFTQGSTQVLSSLNGTGKSDLLLVNSGSVCVNNSSKDCDASNDCSVRVVSESDGQNDPDTQALPTTSVPCNVGLVPTASVNSVKALVQTADKDCQTTDSGADCGTCTSMDEVSKTNLNTSSWSAIDDLPALTFFCNICGDVVDCQSHSKSLIFNHYAGHGITNIDLMDETTASGEKVIKLVELPVVKANTSKTIQSTADDEISSSKSILVQPRASSQANRVEFGISNTATASAGHTRKKHQKVRWADEVCNAVPQQSQYVSSPMCLDSALQNTTMSLSEERLASYSSQETALSNNGSEVSHTLYNSNNVTISQTSVALRTERSVSGSSSCSPAVGDSVSHSFPVTCQSDTVSSAVQHPNPVKTSSERARPRMFWSNNLGSTTSFGDPFSEPEHPYPSHRPVLTAVPLRSKRAASNVLHSMSAPGGHSPLANSGSLSTRANSYTPEQPVMTRTRTVTLNNRQPYLQEKNIICID